MSVMIIQAHSWNTSYKLTRLTASFIFRAIDIGHVYCVIIGLKHLLQKYLTKNTTKIVGIYFANICRIFFKYLYKWSLYLSKYFKKYFGSTWPGGWEHIHCDNGSISLGQNEMQRLSITKWKCLHAQSSEHRCSYTQWFKVVKTPV